MESFTGIPKQSTTYTTTQRSDANTRDIAWQVPYGRASAAATTQGTKSPQETIGKEEVPAVDTETSHVGHSHQHHMCTILKHHHSRHHPHQAL